MYKKAGTLLLSVALLPAEAEAAAGAETASSSKWLNAPKYRLPEVDFNDLVVLDESASLQITQDLITLGAVQITNIPRFREARETALVDLATCLSGDGDAVSVRMNDNTKRVSAGAASMHGVPTKMSSACGEPSSQLRSAVDAATRQMLLALDLSMALHEQNPPSGLVDRNDVLLDMTYNTFEKIHASGEHLEHLHAFTRDGAATSSSDKNLFVSPIDDAIMTMPMHTDNGLFIAMTSGYYKDSSNKQMSNAEVENGLYMQLSSGSTVKVVTDDNSLIVMMGEGASNWLAPRLGQPLRAVPHAMTADVSTRSPSISRAWFGKMYLPPADATSAYWHGLTYGQFKAQTIQATQESIKSNHKFLASLPTACGSSVEGYVSGEAAASAPPRGLVENAYTAHFKPMVSNTLCDNDGGVMCWQQCYTGSDLPSCGTQAECVDPATGEAVDGSEMCQSELGMNACILQCPEQNVTDAGFCYGPGTSMFMSGFTSISTEDKGATACVNLFFDTWTLDSKTKYVIGCLGIFFLAIFFEYMKVLKRQILSLPFMKRASSLVKDCVSVSFYGAQLTISYFLMLAAMTYSTELFCAMISGLTVGYALFTLKNTSKDSSPTCHDTGAEETDELMKVVVTEDMPSCCSHTVDVENSSTKAY